MLAQNIVTHFVVQAICFSGNAGKCVQKGQTRCKAGTQSQESQEDSPVAVSINAATFLYVRANLSEGRDAKPGVPGGWSGCQ